MTRDGAGTVVRIEERGRDQDQAFRVRVRFGDEAAYEVTVADPGDADSERNLGWYFEEHLRFPFLDKDLEERAVAAIAGYGRDLFGQVFGGAASRDYRSLRDLSFDGWKIEVSGSAEFQALHWEALRDPDLPEPLATLVPVTRQAAGTRPGFAMAEAGPTLNLLVVTARPGRPGDVAYRTISRPLLNALRDARLPVNVDLVRPGTWEALQAHLRDAAELHGPGWYQIAHFDMHGSFIGCADLVAMQLAGGLARGFPVERFQGRRGFLFFESGQAGKAFPVAAEDVAGLRLCRPGAWRR